jgi:uncharacterized membrane protein YdjX (TVP38/TMEM64 family)
MKSRAIDDKTKLKFLTLLLIVFLLILSVNYFGLTDYFDVSMVRDEVDRFGYFGPVMFILIYAVATVAFIPGTILTIASGVVFGTFLGTVYTIIGATIGATIAFMISRYLGKGFVEYNLHYKFPKLGEYNNKLNDHGFVANLFLRLVPIFPFNGLNYALGLTKIKSSTYILSTALGIIPGSFVLAYFGNSLVELDVVNIVISVILFILLILIYPVYLKFKKKGVATNRR